MKNHRRDEERPLSAKSGTRLRAALLVTCVSFLWPGMASTQERSRPPPPEHAYANDDGAGWECDFGYKKTGTACVAIEIPSHAYMAPSGRDWNCERGFKKTHHACEVIRVPPNARLTSSGDAWMCNAGFRRRGQGCDADGDG